MGSWRLVFAQSGAATGFLHGCTLMSKKTTPVDKHHHPAQIAKLYQVCSCLHTVSLGMMALGGPLLLARSEPQAGDIRSSSDLTTGYWQFSPSLMKIRFGQCSALSLKTQHYSPSGPSKCHHSTWTGWTCLMLARSCQQELYYLGEIFVLWWF